MADSSNVFFVNDASDSANWGCRATTRAMLRLIADAGGRLVDALPSGRMRTTERFVPSRFGRAIERIASGMARRQTLTSASAKNSASAALVDRISRLCGSTDVAPGSFADFPKLVRHFRRGEIFRREQETLEESDIVVINGQDAIRANRRDGRMMLFFAYLVKTCFDCRCILVNHSVDLQDPVMAEMAAAVYPLLDDVVFRDPVSAEQCEPFLPDARNRIAPDAAFIYEPADRWEWADIAARPGYLGSWPDDTDRFNPREAYVCVGGDPSYARANGAAQNPSRALEKLCQHLKRAFGQVVLTAACRQDERVMRPISRRLGFPLFGLNTPTQQAVDILGNASLFIGGNWHPSILASTGGTPIIATSAGSHAMAGLLELIELDGPIFDARNLDRGTAPMMRLAKQFLRESDLLRERLRTRARQLASETDRNVAMIANRSYAATASIA